MITQRAVLVGFVGFCFYLIALVNSLPAIYYTLAWLSVGILVSSLGVSLLSLIGLRCRWRVAGGRSGEMVDDFASDPETGELHSQLTSGARLGIEVENGGTLNKTGVAVEVRLYDVRRDRWRAQRFLIEALPSGSALTSELPLHAPGHGLPRGRYFVSEVMLIGSDVLGLFRARKRADAGLNRVRLLGDAEARTSTVVSALQSMTGHARDVCAAVALKAQLEGVATCFRGTDDECRRVAEALRSAGLRAEEVPDGVDRRWNLTRGRPLARRRRVTLEAGEKTISGKAADALARRAALVPGAGFEVIIGPAMAQAGSSAQSLAGSDAREGTSSRLPGQGEEFKGTRPYTMGDDLRRVHWASSARRGELVVREFLRPTLEGAVVVWDGAAPTRRVEELSPEDARLEAEREEAGLRLTASLCRALLESGRPCGLLRADSRPVWLPSSGDSYAPNAVGRVIETLADARADRTGSLLDALREASGARVEGEVFIVTTETGDGLSATLRAAALWRARGAKVRIAQVGWSDPKRKRRSAERVEASLADVTLRPARAAESQLAPVREAMQALLSRYETAGAPVELAGAAR